MQERQSLQKGLVMESEDRPIKYGLVVSARRIGEYYKASTDFVRRLLCRAELNKFSVPGMMPRKYLWCKEMELNLNKILNPKGFYRCTDSKVHSRYSLERESSYSI